MQDDLDAHYCDSGNCSMMEKQACLFFLGNYTLEMGILDPADEQNFTQLLEEVTAAVKADMEEIKNNLLDLQHLNKETKSSKC